MADKFRTGNSPPTGVVFYHVQMPNIDWFWAEVLDTLSDMCDPDNWEQVGTMTVEDASAAAVEMCEHFVPSHLIGTIFVHISSSLPTNALACDGSTYLRSDYPDLYDAVDAAFKPDSTHVKVPDLRGVTIIGDGTGTGLTNRVFNTQVGAETHVLTQPELANHAHTHNTAVVVGVVAAPGVVPASLVTVVPQNTGATGGNNAHNNMQPSLPLHYAIWAR